MALHNKKFKIKIPMNQEEDEQLIFKIIKIRRKKFQHFFQIKNLKQNPNFS